LRTDDDVRTMFSIFSRYMTKEPIELDAKLVRSVEAIMSNMICPRTFNEIAALMVKPGEDEVEAVNLSDP
ncbi:matrix metalloproteinase, partial [Trifolium medium]|nr:matrix metalloproteinase [Trifolium medium]